jgi:ribosomal protein L21E
MKKHFCTGKIKNKDYNAMVVVVKNGENLKMLMVMAKKDSK